MKGIFSNVKNAKTVKYETRKEGKHVNTSKKVKECTTL